MARFLRATAETLAQVSGNVWAARSMVGSCWRGPAAYLFGRRVSETIATIETGPPACHAAAGALERLADEIEDARRRALAAEADAAFARQRLDAATLESITPGPATFVDPVARYALQRRLDEARDDLEEARSRGARAAQDALDAGRRAATTLHAAADSVKVPPPPPGPDVVPFETTREWIHRQLGDFLVDPMTFWSRDKTTYERGRVVFDLYTGSGGGVIDGANRFRGDLFRGITEVGRVPGLYVVQYKWIQRPGALPEVGFIQTQQSHPIYSVGPDPVAGGTIQRIAQFTRFGGWALTGGTAALDQWVQDRQRRDLSGGQRVGRMAANAISVGIFSSVGGTIGFNTGATVMGVIGLVVPGAGSAAGGVAGGVAGSVWGGGIGQVIGEKFKGLAFNLAKVN